MDRRAEWPRVTVAGLWGGFPPGRRAGSAYCSVYGGISLPSFLFSGESLEPQGCWNLSDPEGALSLEHGQVS